MCPQAVKRQMSTGLQGNSAQPCFRDGRRWGEQHAVAPSKKRLQQISFAVYGGVETKWGRRVAAHP